jgi:hypothetical protein
MCLNCGCGEPDTRHKDSDIVQQDVQKAADGQGMSRDETIQNIESSLQKMRSQQTAGTSSTGSSRY